MMHSSTSESLTSQQIELLRQQIAELERLERGQQPPRHGARVAPSNFAHEDLEETPQPTRQVPPTKQRSSDPPPPPRKDFTVQEIPSTSKSSRRCGQCCSKACAWVLGLALVGIVAIGVMKLIDYMQTNDIQFARGGGGTIPTTLAEVALHANNNDCWVVYHGNVYDMTNYAKRHPDGPGWIRASCGEDGTRAYSRYHGESLLRSVISDKIGPLVENNGSPIVDTPTADNGADTPTVVDCSAEGSCLTLDEVALHATATDCWTVYHGNVYDMTDYSKKHPGGRKWVTDSCGVDGTSEYARYHSKRTLRKVENTLIAPLEGSISNPTDDGYVGGGSSSSED